MLKCLPPPPPPLPMPSSSTSSSASTRSTSSSLSSTFSDLSVHSSSAFSAVSSTAAASPSPPTSSKTDAFFSSSFSASPPPRPPPSLKLSDGIGSANSLVTQAHTPPTPSISSPSKNARFHISRIFPSRFTSTSRDSEEHHDLENAFSSYQLRPKPEFSFGDLDSDSLDNDLRSHTREQSLGDVLLPLPSPRYTHERSHSDTSYSSASSVSSSSSHVEIRLPTPPISSSTDDEPTPRPANLEPSLYSFNRNLKSTSSSPAPLDHHLPFIDAEPHEGTIISNMTYSSGLRDNSSPSPSSLRLVRPLGQGAFSAVWLAEDMSPVPLALTAKQSVRDLRRKASLISKGTMSRESSFKTSTGSMSRNASLKKFGSRVRGTRPSVGRTFLDERDGVGAGSPVDQPPPSSWGVDEDGRLTPCSASSNTHQNQAPPSPLMSPDFSLTASLSRNNSTIWKRVPSSQSLSATTRLVAVKLTPRRPSPYSPEAEERTRVGFVREVEVLRHISHPNITPLFSYLSSLTHHVLVLPYLRGGDLLGLVNSDEAWGRLSEVVLRRMWCEICRGVGWMHSVGLVHRDVKLENVLLTWEGMTQFEETWTGDEEQYDDNDDADMLDVEEDERSMEERRSTSIASSTRTIRRKRRRRPPPRGPSVSELPIPLIKLTDFGLSRFIDIGNGDRGSGEMLTTRCGSEAYAAPELVMGSSSVSGLYDARETDAWACGVVLYALVGRRLPFGEGVGMDGTRGGGRSRIGGERVHTTAGGGDAGTVSRGGSGRKHVMERRQWLMRIARGEYEWPEMPPHAANSHIREEDGEEGDDGVEDGELVGPRLALSEGAKRVVGRLLVRDPRKRARIVELWDDEWMRGDVIGAGMWESLQLSQRNADWAEGGFIFGDNGGEGDGKMDVDGVGEGNGRKSAEEGLMGLGEDEWEPLTEDMSLDEGPGEEEEEEEEENEGWLLDQEGIEPIARQEVI